MVMSFIDANAKDLGIEPICRELAVAPSSYHTHAARLADPAKRSGVRSKGSIMRSVTGAKAFQVEGLVLTLF
jgi:hypothetical protein